METFELRYFLGVAKHENIHKASLELGISPGSLSKAVTRLEDELQVKLFERVGRHIQLTNQGKILKFRASEIIELEASVKLEIGGSYGQLNIIVAGPEVLLSKFGVEFSSHARELYRQAHFDFVSCTEEEAIKKVENREAHFAITTKEMNQNFKVKSLMESHFVTVASTHHEASKYQKKYKGIPVEKLLAYDFVGPSNALLGQVGQKQSADGWRDDKFKRKITYKSSSLKLIEEMVSSGKALAYLPDYLAQSYIESKEWAIINVKGCPYSCQQKIKLVTKSPIDVGWIGQLI